jgi:hypothetical protein
MTKRKNRRNRKRINEQARTDTNITVQFKKVLNFAFADKSPNLSLATTSLSTDIAAITQELGEVYKLFRFVSVSFEFQSSQETFEVSGIKFFPQYAIQYVPAEQQVHQPLPPILTDYEGPAVGYWQNSRGRPYMYTVPSTVLNAMPLNWYETASTTTIAEDGIQGFLYLSTDHPGQSSIRCLAHFTVEFQTLVAPEFISQQLSKLRRIEEAEERERARTSTPAPSISSWTSVPGKENAARYQKRIENPNYEQHKYG